MSRFGRFIAWLGVSLLAACGNQHAGFPADHCVNDCVVGDEVLVVEPANALLLVNSGRQFSAIVISADGSRRDVTDSASWSMADARIATVSAGGDVTGVAQGQSTVTARLPRLEAQARVLVSAVAVREVAVSPAIQRIPPGLTQQYKATAILTDGSTVDITRHAAWSVGNAATATIDQQGIARGLANGATQVTARWTTANTNVSDTAALAVLAPIVTIENYFIEPVDTVTLQGTQVAYRAFVITSDDQRIDVTADTTWRSSDPAIAAIDASGVASALAVGSTDIQATLTYRTLTHAATARLQVRPPAVTALRITPKWAELLIGQQQVYQATAVLEDATEVDVTNRVTWRSDASTVASITLGGVATGVTAGQSRISATLTLPQGSFTDDGTLQVDAPPPVLTSLSVTPIDATVLVDDELRYHCTAYFSDGSVFDATGECRWSVSDENIAVIDALTGLLTGMGAGATQVTARLTYQGIEVPASVGVTVNAPLGIEGLQVTPATVNLVTGASQEFQAHLVFTDGRKLDVTNNVAWTSSNTQVARVDAAGVAIARDAGQTLIRASGTWLGVQYSDAALLSVTSRSISVTGFLVMPPVQSTVTGQRAQFEARLLLSNGEIDTVTDLVTWTSRDGSIAQATKTPGEFIGLRAGTVIVQAAVNYAGVGYSSSARLNVAGADVIVGLEVRPSQPKLLVGMQRQMTATILLSNGGTIDGTDRGLWTSVDPHIAAIGADGVLTGISAGVTTIEHRLFVGDPPFSAMVFAGVLDPSTQLVALRVSPDKQQALVGMTRRFTATAIYLDGSREDVSSQARWDVVNRAVAGLASQDGLIIARSEGATPVSARLNAHGVEVRDEAEFDVRGPLVEVTEIQVTPARSLVATGNRARFTATAVLNDRTHIDVTDSAQWQSGNENIARATRQPGEFATLQPGAATVTATFNFHGQPHAGQAALIAVSPEPRRLEVTPRVLGLTVGEQHALQAIVHYTDGSTEDVTNEVAWQSQDATVALVGSAALKGLVLGRGAGTTTVTATYRGSLSDAARVTVTVPQLLSIAVIPSNAEVAAGVVQSFTAIGTYDDESSRDITARALWTSSDEAVASIVPGDEQGKVRGVSGGSATISAALDGVTGSAGLTVTPSTVVSIDVAPDDARVLVGGEKPFIAIARLSDGSAKEVTGEVTWQSSNTGVASVSNDPATAGIAQGLSGGSATIQAWYQGTVSDSSPLQVIAGPLPALIVLPENQVVSAGSNVFYTATAILTDGTRVNATQLADWESSNFRVAYISNGIVYKGIATTSEPGTTVISATVEGVTTQTNLTVTGQCNGKEDSVLIVNDITVRVGETAQLQVTGLFPDGCVMDLTGDSPTVWESSDDDVFTVGNKSGVVKGVSVGVASVEVKHRSNTDTATVTVIP